MLISDQFWIINMVQHTWENQELNFDLVLTYWMLIYDQFCVLIMVRHILRISQVDARSPFIIRFLEADLGSGFPHLFSEINKFAGIILNQLSSWSVFKTDPKTSIHFLCPDIISMLSSPVSFSAFVRKVHYPFVLYQVDARALNYLKSHKENMLAFILSCLTGENLTAML